MSDDLPVKNALQPSSLPDNSTEAFVAMINPALGLGGLVYASYVSGPGYQIGYGVDTDSAGNIYLTGQAYSDVFNGTGAKPPESSNTNVFLLVFRPVDQPARS